MKFIELTSLGQIGSLMGRVDIKQVVKLNIEGYEFDFLKSVSEDLGRKSGIGLAGGVEELAAAFGCSLIYADWDEKEFLVRVQKSLNEINLDKCKSLFGVAFLTKGAAA